jgi:hypothetical protein
VKVTLYALFTVPTGRLVGLSTTAGLTVIE